jgi:hypothetical protein
MPVITPLISLDHGGTVKYLHGHPPFPSMIRLEHNCRSFALFCKVRTAGVCMCIHVQGRRNEKVACNRELWDGRETAGLIVRAAPRLRTMLAAMRRDRLLDRAQRLVDVAQLVLRRHALPAHAARSVSLFSGAAPRRASRCGFAHRQGRGRLRRGQARPRLLAESRRQARSRTRGRNESRTTRGYP